MLFSVIIDKTNGARKAVVCGEDAWAGGILEEGGGNNGKTGRKPAGDRGGGGKGGN